VICFESDEVEEMRGELYSDDFCGGFEICEEGEWVVIVAVDYWFNQRVSFVWGC